MNTTRIPLLFLLLFSTVLSAQIYVSPTGTGDGSSWAQATNLADALRWAYQNRNNNLWSETAPLQIWASNGVHYPRYNNSGDDVGATSRQNTFTLVSNVQLYGGFQGTETTLSDRVLPANRNFQTILSGDYNGDDNITGFGEDLVISGNNENVLGVVQGQGDLGVAVLDGFQVTGGYANSSTYYIGSGLRVNNIEGLSIQNVLFRGNMATGSAGAVFVNRSSPGEGIVIEDCDFRHNYGESGGGGLTVFYSEGSTVRNSRFIGNYAANEGGGLRVTGSYGGTELPEVSNCTFSRNWGGTGGAIYTNADLLVRNSLVFDNSGGYGGGLFVRGGNMLTIINSTIVNNIATVGGGMSTRHGTNNRIRLFNSIVLGNTSRNANFEDGVHLEDPTDELIRRYSLVQGFNGTANGNLSASGVQLNHVFQNPATNDFSLLSSSPGVNAGSNSLYNSNGGNLGADLDLNGQSRRFGANIDMGAYELQDEPTLPTVPGCATNITPANNATDVAVDTNITWDAVSGADGYYVNIGTTSGGTELVNNADVTTGTSYNPTTDFPEDTDIFVTVVPYNSAGNATGCSGISFTTETLATVPNCTVITSPTDGATDVAVNANIVWDAVTGADGYYVSIGTTLGGTELVDNADVTTGTSYNPTTDFPEDTEIFVSVIPYNTAGNATGCSGISFTTETLATVPNCTVITSPTNGATDVNISTNITWNAVSGADGYYISIGTTSGGTELVDNADVTTGTSYNPTSDFPEDTEIFVSVIPYNAAGNATGCSGISFTTETLVTVPNCATITSPTNGATDVNISTNITWNAVTGADGYYVNIGTTSGGTELVNNADVTTGTSYNPTSDFPEDTDIFVSVIPYNSVGPATGCSGISFTTETLATVPGCTTITGPTDGATDVAVDANIVWNAVTGADGYYVNIGTTSGGTELVNNADVTTGTSYNPTTDFPEDTEIFVSVIPYNSVGEATGCSGISFTTEEIIVPTVPDCATIAAPTNGATDVAVNANIVWNAVTDADGYYVNIGTTSGGTELVDNADVTSGTSYNPTSDFPEDTEIFVSVIPYNSAGNATGCSEISFTTEDTTPAPTVPNCTVITGPTDGATDVAVNANIVWNAVTDADGYYVNIGTTSGGTELVDNADVTSGTSYNPTSDFPEDTEIFVSVIPYNSAGNATGCSEISFTTEDTTPAPTVPNCTVITGPTDGATDVAVNANIVWNAVSGADGYYVSIGTISGGTELVNNADVTTGTSYNPTSDFPEDTDIFVSVIPYNSVGPTTGCSGISFTTETLATVPGCTTITGPTDGATDVAVDANIVWNAVTGADGYYVNIGTTSGGTELVNNADVTTGTSYNPTTDFPENTNIFISVIPYNSVGPATGCSGISFTTETLATAPTCTTIISPTNGATDVNISTNITWNAVSGADGYYVSIGTTSGGTELVDNADVTSGTSYNPTSDFPEDTEIFVSVIPYNSAGNATGCSEISFTTEDTTPAPTVPNCTVITGPTDGATDVAVNANIVWNAVTDADGYYVNIGTTSGGTELVDNADVTSGTSYNPTSDFPEDTEIFVSVIPYNSAGNATGCSEISFTTEDTTPAPTVPNCTVITGPTDGATDVAVNANIVWNAVSGADGYYVSIGTTSGGTELVDNADVTTGTSYNPTTDFPEDTEIFVSVIPYNSAGNATGCSGISFTTETRTTDLVDETKYGFSPNGDGINDVWVIHGIENYPENIVSIYNRWGDMVFQIRGYNNGTNVFRGTANRLRSLGADQLPSGTYFFQIENLPEQHHLKKTTGFLVLKR